MVYTTLVRAVSLQSAKLAQRVPSIKFRKGAMSAGSSASGTGAAAQQVKGASTNTVILEELPARFKRQPISDEEIAYINNGGVP